MDDNQRFMAFENKPAQVRVLETLDDREALKINVQGFKRYDSIHLPDWSWLEKTHAETTRI